MRRSTPHVKRLTLTARIVVDVHAFAPRERSQARAAVIDAAVSTYRLGIAVAAVLALLSGLISLGGISNALRPVAANSCPGGALCGASASLGDG